MCAHAHWQNTVAFSAIGACCASCCVCHVKRPQVAGAGFLQRTIFSTGCALKHLALNFGICNVPGVDQLVFDKIKSRLGGRVKVIVSGGAPLAQHVEHFLKLTMCCPVTQVRLHRRRCASASAKQV